VSEYVYLLNNFVKAFWGEVKICGSFTQKFLKECGSLVTTAWRILRLQIEEILRVAVNILNKQSLTADKGWSSSWVG
jgi:hypothetical protein